MSHGKKKIDEGKKKLRRAGEQGNATGYN